MVVVSVEADEVALRRGITIFGMCEKGNLRKRARITANKAKLGKR